MKEQKDFMVKSIEDIMATEQEEISFSTHKSAHKLDNDSWQKVGLMLVTSFNCVYILGYSNLILVPLGLVWGIIGMVVLGAFSLYANLLLANLYIIDGQRFIRYRDLVGHVFGKKMYYITWALQFAHFILCNMGFLLLSGRSLKDIFLEENSKWVPLKLPEFIMISGFTYFIFAFWVPHLSALGMWYGISAFFTVLYIAISMIISIKDGKSGSKDYNITGQKEEKIFNALGAIAAIVFANNSGMLPEIQATLQRPAIKNMHKALYLQFTFGIAIYYMVTIVGYWAYGSSISDYMLGDLINGPRWAKILANSSVFLQTIVSQHIFCVPVHEALDTRFCKLDEHESSVHNLITRFILRALFFTFSTLCAAMFPFLGDFVTLVGALSLVPLTFLFPALVFLKVKWCRISTWEKSWHIFTVVLFGLLTLGSTISAIRLIIINAKTYHVFANT
ncbi:hypothetical protein SUGI_0851270 [Cryptomeria japonica]|uniref:probable proline transporter 2 n=1 Tax=Cryptomeria japonica TaxID=3369 RepID=UPI002414A3FF|nr:probable proline transporter 2 [Cryptomeria japonica]GLJ41097.1 hypothetical protein SUGI_0851270 [Cryptomeria japonica]